MLQLLIDCDQRLTFNKVRDDDGNYLNNGTCTYAVVDPKTGNTVYSGTLSYVTSSNGKYTTVIDGPTQNSLLTYRKFYKVNVVFTKSGIDHRRYVDAIAVYAT